MLAGCIVYLAENINTYLARNWKSFAKQPYFDQQGIFFSALFSAPLLVVMFILVVSCIDPRKCHFNDIRQTVFAYQVKVGLIMISFTSKELLEILCSHPDKVLSSSGCKQSLPA